MAETEEYFAGHRRIERVGTTTTADVTSGSLAKRSCGTTATRAELRETADGSE